MFEQERGLVTGGKGEVHGEVLTINNVIQEPDRNGILEQY